MTRWTADDPQSFPEPESFNGQDDRPTKSASGKHGGVTAQMRARDIAQMAAYVEAFIRLYGRTAFDDVVKHLEGVR